MKLKSSSICTVLIVVALSAVFCFPSGAGAQERKVTVRRSELPAVIRKAIAQAVPGARIVKIEKEIEGEDPGQYDVEMRSGQKEYEVEISPQGEVKEVREITSGAEEDSGVEQIKKWTDSFNLENCIRVEETSGLDPNEKYYKTYAPGVGLIQDEDLVLVRYAKVAEQSLSMADVPRRVRATIRKHAGGAKVREIEIMRYALHALAEAEKMDAADLLERAIHSRELALEGRRDEEAMRIREGAPSRGAQIEILMLAEKILREQDQTERATAVGRLAEQMRGREQR
jgi:hypothetical protein